jgi:protein-S-isoprenylcysteine O-methyltransferase Ste14
VNLINHDRRDDLAGEHKMGDAGQLVFTCLFLAVWVCDTFLFGYTTFLNDLIPLVVRIPFGIILLVLSLYLSKTGLSIVFGEKSEKPAVIRKGVFGLVRHPVYLGELLFYLGIVAFSISLAAAAVVFFTFLFLHFIARHEEKLLIGRYGVEYRRYMEEVPMWLPIRFLRSSPRTNGRTT